MSYHEGLDARVGAVLCALVLASACSSQDGPDTPMNAAGPQIVAGSPAPTPTAGAQPPAGGAAGAPAASAQAAAGGSGEPAADETPATSVAGQGGTQAPSTPSAGDAAAAAREPGSATNATGPGDWSAGDYPPGLTEPTFLEISGVAGQMGPRQYKVHVPPSYDPEVPTPAVFCIHGLAQDALLFCVTGAGWNSVSDEKGFILIMPNGYQNSWNAGTCCGGASASQLDDVALFRALLEEVGSHVNIDLDRVYATGLSNGGYMSYRLACEASDIFAAVAPGAGAVGINSIGGGTNPVSDFTACEPSQPVAVLDLHGTADPLVPYSLQAPSLATMADAAGCDDSTVPATAPSSGGDTECVSYAGCGVEITGCSVTGGGHCWFGSEDCGTGGGAIGLAIVGANSDTLDNNAAIVDFFERNAR